VDDTRVYTTGQFAGTTDFDAGDGSFPLTSNPGGAQQDGYIAAYERADGAFAWAGAISGNNLEKGTSIATDGERVYVGGFFSSTVDFDPGAGMTERTVVGGDVFDPFVAAYTASGGEFVWVNAMTSTAPGSGSEETAAVAVIGSRVYAVGRIAGTADFEDGPGVSEASALGFDDAFFASYNVETGAFADVNMIGGPSNERSLGVTVSPDDVIVVGAFATRAPGQTVDFDPGPGETPLTSNGDLDAFVAAYSLPDGVPTEPLAPEAAARLSVWPNPSASGATVRLETAASGSAEVVLLDALGRRVATLFSGAALAGQTVEAALPPALAPGLYLVRATTPEATVSRAVTVMR
ncbi:MAG: T9SS type A sorting domain-containing protein, partial [Bacteroidota bacterium]